MTKKYDVIIIGSGPAGIFAALEITKVSDLRLLLIEKGKDLGERVCPSRVTGKACISCTPCNMVCGLGGAGAFSDGKLTLTPEVGVGSRTTWEKKEPKLCSNILTRFMSASVRLTRFMGSATK
jgi:uncharacterized FAD-dependent dehydrogenase